MTIFVVSFVLWAVLHSVTAAPGPKGAIRRQMGERAYAGLYRLLYNLFSGMSFLPVLYLLATRVPDTLLWSIPSPFHLLAYLIQLGGFIGLLIALWQTDVWEFVGLRQAVHFFSGRNEPAPSPQLVTHGMYALTRHPLYLFSLLVLWFNPVMTFSTLLFNILATVYFWVGAYYEERRLATFFGEAYQEYRRQVPYLLPLRLTK